jgi:tetratricopeptide (TPR) repeat protein
MSDSISETDGDCLTPSNPFNPGQYAMHGLLSALFHAEQTDPNERAEILLARALQRAPRGGGTRSSQIRRWAVGGAAATCLMFILAAIFFKQVEAVRAEDGLLRIAAAAGSVWLQFLAQADPFLSDDPNAISQRVAAMERVKARRDRGMAALQHSKDPNDPSLLDVRHPWQAYYCGLRDLGRRDEAVAEVQAAIEYTRHNPTGAHWRDWEAIYLDGLGNVHACFGEFAQARDAYRRSIDARLALDGVIEDPNRSRPGYLGHNAIALAPLYLRMMLLSLAQNDVPQARDWQASAERVMREQLATICQLNGIGLNEGASLWETWMALPPDFRQPRDNYTERELQAYGVYRPASLTVAWVRAILYHQARLHDAESDYAAAGESLDRAAGVRDYPLCDELRLSFAIPVEYARLAIARRDYATTLLRLDEAELVAGQMVVSGEPDINQAPIPPSRQAELRLLRGIALLGLDDKSEAGMRLVQKAIGVPEKMAATLSAAERAAFMKQFEPWQRLAGSSAPGPY